MARSDALDLLLSDPPWPSRTERSRMASTSVCAAIFTPWPPPGVGAAGTTGTGNAASTSSTASTRCSAISEEGARLYPATGWTGKLKTSQIALPTDVCQTVYASTGYSASDANLSRVGFSTDNVFSDGVTLQMASITGSVADGLVAGLTLGIAA